MNITIIGTGYVGLVTGALFADRGNTVTCVDKNQKIVNQLKQGNIHIYEPGLKAIVEKALALNNIKFTTNLNEAVSTAKVIFLAVGTPSNEDGSFNLSFLEEATKDLAKALKGKKDFKVIVVKSTVPQGTHKKISAILDQDLASEQWAYVSNPETLAEGTSVKDFAKPDRIIIGTDSEKAFALMEELYHPFNIQQNRLIRGSPADAELAKLFSNTALAIRVAMVNEFSRIADVTPRADMDCIRKMICSDKRIGFNFMFPGPGYGGSCFPKDIQGVVSQSKNEGYSPLLLSNVHSSNEKHKAYLSSRILKTLKNPNNEKMHVAVWGLTFKPNTDDMRDAASIPIIARLLEAGIKIVGYDPQDKKAREIFGNKILFVEDKFDAVKGADALLLLTEWKEFDSPDFKKLYQLMRGNQLFDFRNRWLPKAANNHGFEYYGVGRSFPETIK